MHSSLVEGIVIILSWLAGAACSVPFSGIRTRPDGPVFLRIAH